MNTDRPSDAVARGQRLGGTDHRPRRTYTVRIRRPLKPREARILDEIDEAVAALDILREDAKENLLDDDATTAVQSMLLAIDRMAGLEASLFRAVHEF